MNSIKRNCMPSKIHGAEFTLTIGCKLNCHYCPQQKLIQRYVSLYGNRDVVMTFETFKTCLNKIERGSGISFGGMSEAFQNKECAKMVKYAYDLGYKVSMDTTLVGATEDDFEMLKDVKFGHFQLHIPDKENKSNFIITEEYLRVFQLFNEHFTSNGYSCHGEVHDAIKGYLRKDIPFADKMMNRAGNLEYEELEIFNHKGKLVCGNGEIGHGEGWNSDSLPNIQNGLSTGGIHREGWNPDILPNGTVVLCCMDYGMEHILGNLLVQDWDEILYGDEFITYEKGLEDETIPSLCRKCPVAMPKGSEDFEYSRLLGPNAIRVARVIENYRSKGLAGEVFGYTEKDINIIKLLGTDNVCLFGLGKLFKDNYYQSLWHNVVQANIFSDNKKELWGKNIHGIKCVAPEELRRFDNLTVVTYVTNDSSIQQQLRELGIKNIINIFEIYNLCS